ncbi:hypothetical protein [Pontibacter actiniarum]|uniref:GAF domain-containing protein n=1 Tax=Pontibacter actiniarum TaxID=323450 RepID=A0A1X9YX89_9BACT|nr:hypothetical protein [Pontibacter actiniarum]ARS37547.1 hypothetical protein CA264_20130 [Pontibacter actiniarum]
MNHRATYTSQKAWTTEEEYALDKAIGFTNSYVGYDFFNDACRFISSSLGVKHALIGRVTSDAYDEIQTLGFTYQGAVLPVYTYKVKGSPCESTLFHQICYYPYGVQKYFPDDEELKRFGIESYMGIALSDPDENRLGVIALMDDKPVLNPTLSEIFITILSPRVEEELLKLTAAVAVG